MDKKEAVVNAKTIENQKIAVKDAMDWVANQSRYPDKNKDSFCQSVFNPKSSSKST